MSHKKRKMETEDVVADLPITPMLDMSFQLLSFFIMTFHPTATEGQIAMTLPPSEQGGGASNPDITAEQPKKYVVRVASNEVGQISKMTFREEGSPDDGGEDLGADLNTYRAKIKSVAAAERKRIDAGNAKGSKIPPPKLTLELGDKLLQEYVIGLFDAAVQAEFSDISPVPISKDKR